MSAREDLVELNENDNVAPGGQLEPGDHLLHNDLNDDGHVPPGGELEPGDHLLLNDLNEEGHEPGGGDNGSEIEEWLKVPGNYHPLRNNLLLDVLFEFVRQCDLKTSRVVSKNWNFHSIPHMRSTFIVTIHGSQTTEQNNKPNEDTRRINDFVNLFGSNPLEIPFSKFRLAPFCMTDRMGKRFLKICGEAATEIDLTGFWSKVCKIEDVSELLRASPNIQDLALPGNISSRSRTVIKLFPDVVPTLTHLKKITFQPDRERSGLKFCPTFVDELLTAAPNISDVAVFEHFLQAGPGVVDGIGLGVVLDSIERLGLESSIQFLHIDSPEVGHAQQLLRMGQKVNGLNLKSLILITDFARADINTIQLQLATCFKDSLQHFSVEQCVDNSLMEFPLMPNLKPLTFSTFPDFDPVSVNLNLKFPVLETFTFYQNNEFEDWAHLFSRFDVCPTVNSLYLCNDDMNIRSFGDVLRVFPSLTQMDFRVGEDGAEILRRLWSQMTRLESLSVTGSIECAEELELDSIFTGIPTQTLKEIRHIGNDLEKMGVQERKERIRELQNDHCRLPSIRNLAELKSMDLDIHGTDSDRLGRQIFLSDVTAYLALHSMNHLIHLNVRSCDFTKASCEMLRKETALDTWGFHSGNEKIIPPFLPH